MQRIETALVFVLIGVIASSGVFAQRQASGKSTAGQIDNYIRRQRTAIEKYYQDQIEELKLRAKVQAEDVKKTGLASLADEDAARKRRQIDEQGFAGKDSTITEQEKAAAEKLIANRQQRIKARLERAIAQLEKSKKYALEVTLADTQHRLKRDLLGPGPEPRRGVVTGIVHSDEGGSALLDGRIVHKGDTIDGVKVVRINRRSVEFERDGNRWKQRVGEKRPVQEPAGTGITPGKDSGKTGG